MGQTGVASEIRRDMNKVVGRGAKGKIQTVRRNREIPRTR
jgi:hypothetical protein